MMQNTGQLSLLLAGDAIITQPWSHLNESSFLGLVQQIRSTDVSIVNLELVLSGFRGYPQVDSGGTHLSASPQIAQELEWAGFNMLVTANNHSFDFGSERILESLRSISKTNLVQAGTGMDLPAARQPAYFDHASGMVALVAITSTFEYYGRAGMSRADFPGRPGFNPLEVLPARRIIRDTTRLQKSLIKVLANVGIPTRRPLCFRKFRPADLAGNLAAVRQARRNADLVVLSLHTHERRDTWIQAFAHQAVDAGADVVFIHGPHFVDGIEIYKGKPILHGLGNFVFQPELVEKLPAENYEKFGLGDEHTMEDIRRARCVSGRFNFPARPEIYETFIANLTFHSHGPSELKLVPVDLSFGQSLPRRGSPRLADAQLGQRIIKEVQEKSRRFGTRIEYSSSDNVGRVILPLQRAPASRERKRRAA